MKKYFFGLFAVVIALGIVAFKSESALTTITLEFTGTDVFDPVQVADETLWTETGNPSCVGTKKACKMTVDQNYTTGSPRYLDAADVTITAVGNATDGYRPTVTSGSSGTFTAINKN